MADHVFGVRNNVEALGVDRYVEQGQRRLPGDGLPASTWYRPGGVTAWIALPVSAVALREATGTFYTSSTKLYSSVMEMPRSAVDYLSEV
ncbi:hypothetical protein ACWGE0_26305 [Lentzea sp. NPDC054927]